jgi:Secretion system C-terminal sorting domain
MKKAIFIVCLCFFSFLRNSHADTIYAVVNVDTAFIMHDAYHTNCGSLFFMEFDELESHINVFEIDTGDYAFCHCFFNLITKIGPLSPGNYSVDVYGKWRDYPGMIELFGSTSFIIGGNIPGSPVLLGNYQSDCFQNVGTEDQSTATISGFKISLHPNPVKYISSIEMIVTKPGQLEILAYNLMGQPIGKVFNGWATLGEFKAEWDVSSLNPGIYYLKFRMGEEVGTQKVLIAR